MSYADLLKRKTHSPYTRLVHAESFGRFTEYMLLLSPLPGQCAVRHYAVLVWTLSMMEVVCGPAH
jgi:hypothetical protein